MHTPAKPVDQRVFSNGKMVQPQGSANASMSTMAGSSMGVAQGVVVQNGEHQQDGEQADPAEEEESVAGSLGCAIATMLFSIPALVGS